MNTKHRSIGLFFIIALIIGLVLFRPKMMDDKKFAAEQPAVVPTLFVHGYKGSERSFSTMLSRMSDQQWGEKMLVCRVSKNGRISLKGTLSEEKDNPFIQVIFENNRARINDQTKWLQNIMKILKDRYNVHEINLVGHSMGGLALTNYLETVNGHESYPKTLKLVTIGSPFKGIDHEDYFELNYGEALKDLRVGSIGLRLLIDNKESFPANIKVLSIVGVISDPSTGDGLVSQQSALGNRDIVKQDQFNEVTIHDQKATHFGLHEHLYVDQLIAEFLWEQ
ncbi:alpha/beta fold hydrolase [Bacillus sp. FSL K6-3431]|uniref:alpha/beta fold hydrolase n=1 Tax=Bacillus sp. FSL K6-3431 TaxID=2921500 RepID=UPI0030F743AD